MALFTVGSKIARARTFARPELRTQEQLADAIGVSRETVTKYETGQYQVPPKRLARIAALTGFPLAWFLDGNDTEPPGVPNSVEVSLASQIDKSVQLFYWGEVPCGNWSMPTGDTGTVPVSASVESIPGDKIAVRVGGKSMEPLLHAGELCVVKLTKDVHEGQIVLAHNDSGELTLKLLKRDGGVWILHSANPNYPDATADQWEVLGKVVHIEQTNPDGIYFS